MKTSSNKRQVEAFRTIKYLLNVVSSVCGQIRTENPERDSLSIEDMSKVLYLYTGLLSMNDHFIAFSGEKSLLQGFFRGNVNNRSSMEI